MTPVVGKTVLIVEDNDLNMKLFNDLLEVHGYRTVSCRDGRSALDAVRQSRPDLILLDVLLPKMSGLQLTTILKGDPETKDVPILAVTACALKGDEERILAGGCDGYLPKPITVQGFIEAIAQFTE